MIDLEPFVDAVRWDGEACLLLDQTRLPREEIYLRYDSYEEIASAIQKLIVRGAPALGVAGAYASVLAARRHLNTSPVRWDALSHAFELIANARPTAVNLTWAVKKVRNLVEALKNESPETILKAIEKLALEIHREDIEANRKIAQIGASYLTPGKAVMTYCNTGDLATGGIGTAFGVFRAGFLQGKVSHVYACETRPILQGLRLTSWELAKNKIPFTMICDNMAASILAQGRVGAVIVGADRIAANGDVANKVGTFGLAILAKHFGVPFFVAAPCSTFDRSLASGDQIPIEQRSPEEIYAALGNNRPAQNYGVANPAFDVTPHALIRAIFCEKGAVENPSLESVDAVFSSTSPSDRL